MRKADRKVNHIFPIKHINKKELKSFEKANIMTLPAGFSNEGTGLCGSFIVHTTVLPKLEGDRKIQAKEKVEDREGTSAQ